MLNHLTTIQAHLIRQEPAMHLTNLQLVLALFALSNVTAYLLGCRRGRAALRKEFLAGPVGELVFGRRGGDR